MTEEGHGPSQVLVLGPGLGSLLAGAGKSIPRLVACGSDYCWGRCRGGEARLAVRGHAESQGLAGAPSPGPGQGLHRTLDLRGSLPLKVPEGAEVR